MADKRDDDKILALARKRLQTAMSAASESRSSQLQDLRFFAADPDNKWQWPDDVLKTRTSDNGTITARPCLTVNKLPKHVRQVTNDQRQNRPSGKVIAVSDDAHPEVADVYSGMVRHIEQDSDADVALDTACEAQVVQGEGFWRILTEYEGEDSFDLKIKIGRIFNNFGVYIDPMIQDPVGSDMQWAFITEEITKEEFEHQFPDATPLSSLETRGVGDGTNQWFDAEKVRIAEYFCVETTPRTLNLYPGNVTAFEGTPEDKKLREQYKKPLKSRPSAQKIVKWYKINGYEILDEREWPDEFIPIIRVVGNEFLVEGKVYVSGIVRNAKDAQRMYNYWNSQEAEMLALAPKAPFVGYEGQFEGYEHDWRTANTQNHPYLQVKPVVDDATQQVLPLPQRAAPPMAQTGLIAAKNSASEDIMETTGQFQSDLGMPSNERSGTAIRARQHQGDTGTYHYVDNLARAVRHSTRIIVNLIPKIYDTERVARILAEDGESKTVKINPQQQHAVVPVVDPNDPKTIISKIYNPNVGKYDVQVITGPGYATKRQEALDAMSQILQTSPQLWSVAGDLFVKNMDWPGAEELAKRFKATIDPKILAAGDNDPALQQAQAQIQQLAQQLDHMHQMLLNVNNSFEAKEVAIKQMEAQIKQYDAITKRLAVLDQPQNPQLDPAAIQEIVHGVIDSMIHSGDLPGFSPRLASAQAQPPQEQPAPLPQMGPNGQVSMQPPQVPPPQS